MNNSLDYLVDFDEELMAALEENMFKVDNHNHNVSRSVFDDPDAYFSEESD